MEIMNTINTQITNKALNKELSTIQKAIIEGNKSSWTIAGSFHHIVIDELFETDFGSIGNLAKALNISKSVISRNVNAYVIGSKLDLFHWTVASVTELLPICSKYPIEELNGICQKLQSDGIPSRYKVREYVKRLLTQDTDPAEETETTKDNTETVKDNTEVVDTQSRVDELEALRAEVERLKGVCAKLRQENDKASDIIVNINKERAQLKTQLDEVNTVYQQNLEVAMRVLTTFKIGKSEIILGAKDIAQIVEEYLEGSELE